MGRKRLFPREFFTFPAKSTMLHLDIRVHRCNVKESAWPDQKVDGQLEFGKCTIIEQGTSGGLTSVAFTLTDHGTGKQYMAQITAGLLEMLMGSVRGAEGNWAENPVENIWK